MPNAQQRLLFQGKARGVSKNPKYYTDLAGPRERKPLPRSNSAQSSGLSFRRRGNLN